MADSSDSSDCGYSEGFVEDRSLGSSWETDTYQLARARSAAQRPQSALSRPRSDTRPAGEGCSQEQRVEYRPSILSRPQSPAVSRGLNPSLDEDRSFRSTVPSQHAERRISSPTPLQRGSAALELLRGAEEGEGGSESRSNSGESDTYSLERFDGQALDESIDDSLTLSASLQGSVSPDRAAGAAHSNHTPEVRKSKPAETVRESLSLQALNQPPKPVGAPREKEASEVYDELMQVTRLEALAREVEDLLHLPEPSSSPAPGTPRDLDAETVPSPTKLSYQLDDDELGFLTEVLEGATGDEAAPTPRRANEVLRVSMAEHGIHGFWGGRGQRQSNPEAEELYADPEPGTLNRLLRKEIQDELDQDQRVDLTQLSTCSRSEAGSMAAVPSDRRAQAVLQQRLTELQAAAEGAEAAGQKAKALQLREESLGLLIQLEGPGGDAVLELCEVLVKDYNGLALRLLEGSDFDAVYELLKKAELLTDPTSNLSARPVTRIKLRAITFNNLGCYYKQKGKLHAALLYLEKTVKIEETAALGSVENPASTHLNIAATLSTLGRHSSAVEYAAGAVELLKRDLGFVGDDLHTEVADLMAAGETPTALSILPVAFYNQAVEHEHLNQTGQAQLAYSQALSIARQVSGHSSPMAEMLSKAERAYRKKLSRVQSRRFPSGRGGRPESARPVSASRSPCSSTQKTESSSAGTSAGARKVVSQPLPRSLSSTASGPRSSKSPSASPGAGTSACALPRSKSVTGVSRAASKTPRAPTLTRGRAHSAKENKCGNTVPGPKGQPKLYLRLRRLDQQELRNTSGPLYQNGRLVEQQASE